MSEPTDREPMAPRTDRDLVVARALAHLPVPDHGPGFWERLDASLVGPADLDVVPFPEEVPAAASAPAAVVAERLSEAHAEPQPVTELDPEQRRRARRQRHGRILAVAAVSIAVIAGATWAISATDETGDGRPPAAGPAPSGFGPVTSAPPNSVASAPATTASTAGSPAATTAVPLTAQASAAVDAARQFLADLGAGDLSAAAGRLGPRSEEYLEAQEPGNPNAVHDFLVGAEEGLGAWAASPDAVSTPVEIRTGEYVVVVRGTVRQEGTTAVRAIALPVRFSASIPDQPFVEPWAYDPARGSRIEYSGIGAGGVIEGATVPGGSTVTVHVPSAGTVWFGLVGGDLLAVPTTGSGPGAQASWTFPTGMSGPQTFLAVYEADGFIVANAFTITVS